ncbi:MULTISPECIES: glycine-rich domain-containing protein [unclassified Streptomyces]|uniref:glycine-rich domain-containing protein n=1 Tax=unclassified Streptomyces TaxID=2593676 RepID=UPI0022772408|nr:MULTISPECIES: hypothetical protein [unclassified Streptomyces]
MEDFDEAGDFVVAVPAGVTSVFVQAWGAGGGGAGSDSIHTGGGGGAGGFAWCVLDTTAVSSIQVTIGAGGAGGAPGIGQGGTGGDTVVVSGVNVATANGGGGTSGLTGGGAGGTATCPDQGTTRQGASGGTGTIANPTAPATPGGRPAVDGVVQPAPPNAGTGGDSAPGGFGITPGQAGGNGYVVIWW